MAKTEKPAENVKSTSPADYKATDKDIDKAKDKNPDPDKGSQQPVPDKSQPQGKTAEQQKESAPSEAPPAEKAAEETAEAPVPEADPEAGEPEKSTPSGSHKIIIEGEGQTVIHVEGAVQYLDNGKPITVDDATLAALDAANVEYKKKGK